VQRHLVLDLVVENAVACSAGSMFSGSVSTWIRGICSAEHERQQQRGQVDQPRAAQGEFQQCLFQVRLSISGPTRVARRAGRLQGQVDRLN
jgi:hypothetical protein